jgi:hypothetical protein
MKSIQNPAAALVAAISPSQARRLVHRSVIQGVEIYCSKCGNQSMHSETFAPIDYRKDNKGKTVRVMTGSSAGLNGVLMFHKSSNNTVYVRWENGPACWTDRSRLCIVTKEEK